MPGSSRVAAQISPRLRSHSLPTDTRPAKPTPRARPRDTSAPTMLPLCEATKTLPAGTSGSAKAALAVSTSRVRGLTTPRQLGPRMRMPVCRAMSASCCSRAAPCAPVSEKPLASTETSLTPRRAHSATVSSTVSVGVSTYTWSGTSGRDASEGQAFSP